MRKAQHPSCSPLVKSPHPTPPKSTGNRSQQNMLGSDGCILQTVELTASLSIPLCRLLRIGTDDDYDRRLRNKLLAVGSRSQFSPDLWIPHDVKVPWLAIASRRRSDSSLQNAINHFRRHVYVRFKVSNAVSV
jgi:hypothetical protein